jgi:hypothetical protein
MKDFIDKILENKEKLKNDLWFGAEPIFEEFEIYDYLPIDDRLSKKWAEQWTCTDTKVGIAVYFLDDEMVCVSWQPYRKSDEEFFFVSEEMSSKLNKYFLSFMLESKKELNFISDMPDLLEKSSKIEYKKFEFNALNN